MKKTRLTILPLLLFVLAACNDNPIQKPHHSIDEGGPLQDKLVATEDQQLDTAVAAPEAAFSSEDSTSEKATRPARVTGAYLSCQTSSAPDQAAEIRLNCAAYRADGSKALAAGLWSAVINPAKPGESLTVIDEQAGSWALVHVGGVGALLERIQVEFTGSIDQSETVILNGPARVKTRSVAPPPASYAGYFTVVNSTECMIPTLLIYDTAIKIDGATGTYSKRLRYGGNACSLAPNLVPDLKLTNLRLEGQILKGEWQGTAEQGWLEFNFGSPAFDSFVGSWGEGPAGTSPLGEWNSL